MTTGKRTFQHGNARIAELAANPLIADEVTQVREATTTADRVYVSTLAEIRKAGAGLTQTDLARLLGIDQAGVSKIESRGDLLLSTLRSYLAAAGTTHPRLVVDKDGVEVTLDLDALTPRG